MPSPAAACCECCADRRIAARDGGRIGVTELLVGVPFPPLAFEIMRFATPPRYFADGMLSGATFTPDVALARGLVDELVEPAALLDRAIAAAETLAALSPAAFAQTKQQIRQPVTDAMERHGRRRRRGGRRKSGPRRRRSTHIRDYVARTLQEDAESGADCSFSAPISRRYFCTPGWIWPALGAAATVLCGVVSRRLIEPLHQRGMAVVQRLGEPIGDVVGAGRCAPGCSSTSRPNSPRSFWPG